MKSFSSSFLPAIFVGLAIVAQACGGDEHNALNAPAVPAASGPCSASSDCAGSTPVCDEVAGACVQCLFATQCADGSVCREQRCVATTSCSTSLDCVDAPGATICDPASQTCVACVESTDCEGPADCVAQTCVPYTPCETSLDCTDGNVCSESLKRCVSCDQDEDCQEGQVCVANSCVTRTPCVSDNQCTPQGKLCDKSLGYCVDCLNNQQCPEAWHCAGGGCVLDVCEQGSSGCEGNSTAVCKADGSGWEQAQPCGVQTTCKASGGVAQCAQWVCQAGLTYCDGSKVVTCAADGLSISSSVDCAASSKNCVAGQCTEGVCVPGALYCEGSELRSCNGAGTAYAVLQTCTSSQVCDASAGSCVSPFCSPGQALCNGNVATTCNATGTGFAPGGTDCAAQGKTCSAGTCATCPPGASPPTSVRLAELYLGSDDYVLLENRGNCPVQLDTLRVIVAASEPNVGIEIDLPARVLAPAERVYVIDSTGAQTNDIASADNIFFTADTGGYAMLCNGYCASNTVLDVVSHASGAPPPPLTNGASFSSPLTGITISNENSKAYVRKYYSGAYPSFTGNDWQLGDASRPWVNPAGCPATQPANGGTCASFGQTCWYGAVNCYCLFSWSCQ